MEIMIEAMKPTDWVAVREIYAEGIAGGTATFETAVPDWEDWDREHLTECRLVARKDGAVVGWAALSPVSDRCSYRGVAEVSVYVRDLAQGRGIGKTLLQPLVKESERSGIWTLQAGMFAENIASRKLHLACGFREVGVRKRLGQINGVWHDVLLMERRSEVVGK